MDFQYETYLAVVTCGLFIVLFLMSYRIHKLEEKINSIIINKNILERKITYELYTDDEEAIVPEEGDK